MTKKEILKVASHVANTNSDECSCTHCHKQENGTYLDGLIASIK